MIVAIHHAFNRSPESSTFIVDTTEIQNKDIAVAVEIEDAMELDYEDVENELYTSEVKLPVIVQKITYIYS